MPRPWPMAMSLSSSGDDHPVPRCGVNSLVYTGGLWKLISRVEPAPFAAGTADKGILLGTAACEYSTQFQHARCREVSELAQVQLVPPDVEDVALFGAVRSSRV